MRKQLLYAGAIAVVLALLVGLAPLFTDASSHREAPLIAFDPQADNTDVYVFRSPDRDSTITFIACYYPMEEPAGGPNFQRFGDDVLYQIQIDNDGNAVSDIRYQFRFTTQIQNQNTFLYNTGPITSLTDPDFNVRQLYSVTRVTAVDSVVLASNIPTPPVNIGPASTPNYSTLMAAAVTDLPNGAKVWAGQSDDPFFVDLGSVFDLLTIRRLPGNQGGGVDGLGGYNVHTIALQVPIRRLTRDGRVPGGISDSNAVIGVWGTASRQTTRVLRTDGMPPDYSGAFVQVSRLGMPLVNEVVIPLIDKNKWNVSRPAQDGQFLSYVTNPELAVLLNLLYGLNVPPAPRNDLVTVFLTGFAGLNQPPNVVASEQLRLNMAVSPTPFVQQNRLGLLAGQNDGFPDGRRLVDDVTDIALRVVAGALVPGYDTLHPNIDLGDGVNVNDVTFQTTFPYIGIPHQGFDHTHHRIEPITGIGDHYGDGIPNSYGLFQNYPNPFNPSTEIRYQVAKSGNVKLQIYDVTGRLVRTLMNDVVPAGEYRIRWDGMDERGVNVASGTYFYRLEVDGLRQVRKMMMLK